MAEASCASGEDLNTSYEYLDPVPPSLECPICRQPLQDPVLTPCDHLFCRRCLERALELHPTCPIDRTGIEGGVEGGGCRRPPRVVGELLDELSVRCEACEGEMKRGEWATHGERCRGGQEKDEGLAQKASPAGRASSTGPEDDGEEGTARVSRQETNEAASTFPPSSTQDVSPCAYCSLPLPPAAHPSHLLACPLVPVPCPYAFFGCPFRYPRSSLAAEHLESGECTYEPLKEGLEKAREKWEGLEGENWELKQRVGKLEGVVETLVAELRAVKASLGDFYAPLSASSTSTSSLSATLHSLSSAQTSLSTSLSTLSHSHTAQLSTTSHFAEELAAVRQGLGGLRMQMGGVMMDLQGLYAGGAGMYGAGGGGAAGGGGWRRPGLRPMRTSSSEGEEGGGGIAGGADGSSGSSSDEEGQPYLPPSTYPPLRGGYPFPPPSFSSMPLPLPLPPGMRPVFPSSSASSSFPPTGGEYYDGIDVRLGGLGLDGGGRLAGGRGVGLGAGGGRGRGGVKL